MDWKDIVLWLLAWGGGLAICGAKLAYMLFGISSEPPDDPVALRAWVRKRKWLVISELAALPAFASIAVIIGKLRAWPMEGVVLFSMLLGALNWSQTWYRPGRDSPASLARDFVRMLRSAP